MERIRSTYLHVRRWVDGVLSGPPRRSQLVIGIAFVPYIPVVILQSAFIPVWILCTVLAAAWTLFILWRAHRLGRAGHLRSARHYDRHGKFDLPPEYAASESHMAHRSRQKRNRRQATR